MIYLGLIPLHLTQGTPSDTTQFGSAHVPWALAQAVQPCQ